MPPPNLPNLLNRNRLHALAKDPPPFIPFPSRRSVVHSTNGFPSLSTHHSCRSRLINIPTAA